MEKLTVLRTTSVGQRIAEQETQGLDKYFQKTPLWDQIMREEVDIVFGCKGSGKSAIYNYLASNHEDLIDEYGILALAENPRGTVAFKDLNANPAKDEEELKYVWKLYFIVLIAQKLQEFKFSDECFDVVIEKLQDSDLIPRRPSLTALVKLVRDFVNRAQLEPTIGMDTKVGMIDSLSVKISLKEPSKTESDKGVVSVDHLFDLLNQSLDENGYKIWIAIDRLDAVFQENFDLEASALKTLFQVYIDMMEYDNIRLLIFFRNDIWNRIIDNGFRESSHLTRKEEIVWDENSLFHLIMSRFAENPDLLNYLSIEKNELLNNHPTQMKMFNRIFQNTSISGNEMDFSWIIDKIEDGTRNTSPRELIHLVNRAFKLELKRALERGMDSNDYLISAQSVDSALKDVSKVKLETVLAEYPTLKTFIFRLRGKKIGSRLDELRKYWDTNKKQTRVIADNLTKLGVLYQPYPDHKDKGDLYRIPKLYRPALGYQL